MERPNLAWARLEPEKILVVTDTAAFLLEGKDAQNAGLLRPSEAPLSIEMSRRLLDSAIGAGQRVPVKASPRFAFSAARWAFRLVGYFHTTHATSRLMKEAASRFEAAGKTTLAAWAAGKTRDERGHDDLALRDLVALGYDARALVASCLPATAQKLVSFFEATVLGDEVPTAVVGYAYALERLASTRTAADVAAIEAMLPPSINATRCLRVHSGAGSDADHVEDVVALVAGLSADDRGAVTRAAYETTAIGRTVHAPPLDDDELERLLAPFRTPNSAM